VDSTSFKRQATRVIAVLGLTQEIKGVKDNYVGDSAEAVFFFLVAYADT
jgi:hypothetical protein